MSFRHSENHKSIEIGSPEVQLRAIEIRNIVTAKTITLNGHNLFCSNAAKNLNGIM